MLLHVIEAPGPVHPAVHRAARVGQRGVEQMRDPGLLVDHVHHAPVAQRAGVEQLAARRGVERGAVQIDAAPAVGDLGDRGVEVGQRCIVIVEAGRHGP